MRDLKSKWGSLGSLYAARSNYSKSVVASETYTFNNILPAEGFAPLLLCRDLYPTFPFDIIAEKDGTLAMVEVTLTMVKPIPERRVGLAHLLRANYYVSFVKPDLSWYLVKEITRPTNASCLSEFEMFIKRKLPVPTFALNKMTDIELIDSGQLA